MKLFITFLIDDLTGSLSANIDIGVIKFPTFALSSVGKSSTWRTAIGGAKKGLIGP